MDSTIKAPPIDPLGSIFIFGCGAVGTALALRLEDVGLSVVGGHCRSVPSAERASRRTGLRITFGDQLDVDAFQSATVVIFAVPDPLIRPVAEEVARAALMTSTQVAFHCSGARNASELEPIRSVVRGVASFHPLLSFADPVAASSLLDGAAFAIEGEPVALDVAAQLVKRIGGHALNIEADNRVLYHAAAATASNHLVALAAQSTQCLAAMGIHPEKALKALLPLMKSTLNNLERLGLPQALTGPVSRGDASCVKGHIEAIRRSADTELSPYLVMAYRALEVAQGQGAASSEQLRQVKEVLDQAQAGVR